MIADWIIPTLIALPMVSATIPLISNRFERVSGWKIAATIIFLETTMSVLLISAVKNSGKIIYQVGGKALARPGEFAVGIELMADEVSSLLIFLTLFVALSVLILARDLGPETNIFYSGYLLITGGIMGLLLTHDIFTLFVFLEITGLATYGLIASNRSGEAAVAALKYLMIATVGASIYVIGIGYIYLATGTLNMTDLAQVLAGNGFIEGSLYGNPLVIMGFGFMSFGLLVKTAIFPLHVWQPSAYENAPDTVTAFMAALVSTTSAYALGRIIFTVFTRGFFELNPMAAEIMMILGGGSIIAGSILAVIQNKMKRLLAYSSVSQFGMIVAALGIAAHPAGNSTALTGAIIHLFGHGLIKAGLFTATGLVAVKYNFKYVEEYAGLAKQNVWLAGSIAILGISLVGIPPSIGFLGKWNIVLGAIKSGLWPIAGIIMFSTLLTLLYIAKIIENMFFRDSMYQIGAERTSRKLVAPIIVLVVIAFLSVLLGFAGEFFQELLKPFIEEVYLK